MQQVSSEKKPSKRKKLEIYERLVQLQQVKAMQLKLLKARENSVRVDYKTLGLQYGCNQLELNRHLIQLELEGLIKTEYVPWEWEETGVDPAMINERGIMYVTVLNQLKKQVNAMKKGE
jgi:hypothetical protein